MVKRICLFLIVSLCICLFVNCGNTDYTKEERYLEKVYLRDKYNETDTTRTVTIVKAEKARLYNPKLDDNQQRMILFGTTSFKKYVDAAEAYSAGDISENDVFKTLKEVFTSVEANSDGLIVMMKIRNNDGYFFDILFSNDDVYYSTLTEVGPYISKEVYNYRVKEAKERLREELIDALQ